MRDAISIRFLTDSGLRQFRRNAIDRLASATTNADERRFGHQVADATAEMKRRARSAS